MKNISSVVLIVSLFVGFTGNAWGQRPPQPVGYIEMLGAQNRSFEVIRNGTTSRGGVMMPIYPGDQLQLQPDRCGRNPCTGTAWVQGYGQVTINRSMPHYTVPQNAQPLPLPGGAMQQPYFNQAQLNYLQAQNLGGLQGAEDLSPTLSLLAAVPARLTAGTRPFAIAWQNGKAPYRVRVSQAGQETPLIDLSNLPDRRCQQENVTLMAGMYRVEIQDAIHDPVTAEFQVVPAADLPKPPAELAEAFQQNTLPMNLTTTLFAAWLANAPNTDWKFEAYQMVAPLAEQYHPALLVREQLEQ